VADRRIACVYCGGDHDNAADVRACWDRSRAAPATLPLPLPQPARPSAVECAETTDISTNLHTGPDALARNVVVGVDGTVPQPWEGYESFAVDFGALTPGDRLADRLLELAHARTRAVFRVEGAPANFVERRPPWQLAPGFRFDGELIHHLVNTNSVDLRGDNPRFAPAEMAVALGLAGRTAGGSRSCDWQGFPFGRRH